MVVEKIDNAPSKPRQTTRKSQHSVGSGYPLIKTLMDKGIVKSGTTLYFKKDNSITCKVIDATRVLYKGEETSMTAAARKILRKKAWHPLGKWCLKRGGPSLAQIVKEQGLR